MSDVKLPVRVPNPWDYRAQVTGEIAAWAPPLMSADRDAMPGFELNKARARDLVMSNPFAVNAAEISRDAIVGRNFALALDPDWEHVGASAEAAEEWQRIVEAEWRRYAEGFTFDVDATRKCTFTFLMHQVQFGMHVDGEVLAAVRAKTGETGYVTCLQLIEPERLDRMHNKQRTPDHNEIRLGVERDEYGEPIAYWILNGHRSDAVWSQPGASAYAQVQRFERSINGRPSILHVFDEPRPQMTRGVSLPMLTTLRSMKMLQTFGEAELSRQIQSASYAAVIESEMDYEKAMRLLGTIGGGADVNALTQATYAHMAEVAQYHQSAGLQYNGSKVVHLVPGEKLNIVRGEIQGGQLEMFERAYMRQLAAGLNVSYEELTRDYSNLSYAGGRLGMVNMWRRYYRQRSMLVSKFAMPFVGAWMEEAVMTKRIPMLGKFKPTAEGWKLAKHALVRGDFISWGEPIIDPVKEYTGKGLAMAYGLTTLRDEVASEGGDWRLVLQQRERETKMREKLGLNPGGVDPTLAPGGGSTKPEDGGENGKAGNAQEGRKARSDGPG